MEFSRINVAIKTPNKEFEDQIFNCDLNWNVKDLKKFLNENHPSKPPIEDQRLIFCGHLLKNEEFLKNVFEPITKDNSTVTLHLVFNLKNNEKVNKISLNENQTKKSFETESATSYSTTSENIETNHTNDINTNSFSSENFNSNQYFQFYQQFYIQYMNQFMANQQMNFNFQNTTNDNPTLSNNINLLNSSFLLVPNPFFSASNANVTNAQNANDRNINQENNNQIHFERVNEFNFQDFNSRILVVILIIYIIFTFCSLGSTLVVIGITFIIYLYKLNRQGLNRNIHVEQNIQNINLPANEEQIQQMMDGDIQNLTRRNVAAPGGEVASTEESVQTANLITQSIQPPLSKLRFIWMVISSIFTSLVPEYTPPPAH